MRRSGKQRHEVNSRLMGLFQYFQLVLMGLNLIHVLDVSVALSGTSHVAIMQQHSQQHHQSHVL